MKTLIAATAAFGALALPALAAAPVKISAAGAGGVKVGATYKSLRAKGLLGRQVQGCEAAGPQARGAQLKAPLGGAVELSFKSPRRVKSIIVNKGGSARGVKIGSTKADVVAAYPKAKFDTSTQEVFGITLVKIPKDGGGRLQMGLRHGKVELFGIPYIAFCE